MNLLTVSYYMLQSLVLVLSFFLAIRCLFVHEMRLEAWREPVRHHVIRISQPAFRRSVRLIGWISLVVFLATIQYQISGQLGS